jgi:hypothetical protein
LRVTPLRVRAALLASQPLRAILTHAEGGRTP